VNDTLPFTGERFIPGTRGEIWIEHWHRYHFARRWVAGQRVLDVACGEGYGSALLARTAKHVTGIDISREAIAHARQAYGEVANLEFREGSCTALGIADASIDVAVTFETLEHIGEQEQFLDELARVLAPDGLLILSCPNKAEYTDRRNHVNEFHVKELYREELAALVGARFPHVGWYGQRPAFFSVVAPESPSPLGEGRGEGQFGEIIEISESQPIDAIPRLGNALYFMLVASRSRAALDRQPPVLSVLADRDDWVHRDYEKVMKDLDWWAAHTKGLKAELDGLREEAREMQRTNASLEATLAQRDAEVGARDVRIATQANEIEVAKREIARRSGWRWWLRWPLVKLGIIRE
jgi:SAM-dependent methyltransferase